MALKPKNTKKLAKFLSYTLGRRPDEFGLVPDEQGYISTKELLKAINEEPGWRHIRMAHLKEVSITLAPSPIEFHNNLIRVCERTQLPKITPATQLPKLLYIAVRSRAYRSICERGVQAGGHPYLVLSSDIKMALRIGRRRDHQPVMLTVQVTRSQETGTQYQRYGESLFLADAIYPGTFTGPPLPKEKPPPVQSNRPVESLQAKMPGSYFPEISPSFDPKRPRRKEPDWKKDRRRARKHKYRQQD